MRHPVLAAALAALALGATSSSAVARPARVSQIPNGTVFACSTCHTAPTGGAVNVFGEQVEQTLIGSGASGVVDWPAVFDLDADNDGLTNGEELDDPDGDGVPGNGEVSNPADANDPGPMDPPDPTTTGDTGTDPGDDDGGSGCATGGTAAGVWALTALALLRRRPSGVADALEAQRRLGPRA